MLLVKARVDKSPIHGLGLFAAEFIPKGTQAWRFTPGFDLDLDPHILNTQPDHFRDQLLHYGYIDSRLNRYILCCDGARFINHSDTPNIRPDFSLDRYGVDIAVRDIEIGEEITIDYNSIEGSPMKSNTPMRDSV
ncbi:MAG TPA: SET domain-containing protein [Thermodesulfobacteriota bacterium]|nr:SET domain-containing protein [Thermodesulfobacteriota bacterium]